MRLEDYKNFYTYYLDLTDIIRKYLSTNDFQILDFKERSVIIDLAGERKEISLFDLIKGKT